MDITKIGRYEIEKELAQGGMGIIFLARDPYIQRQVVIKVLMYSRTLDEVYRDFFQQEAELIAALEHPCIVPIYDFGWYGEQPYIVMRHMAGGSLADRLKKEELKQTEIAHVFKRVAEALDAGHYRFTGDLECRFCGRYGFMVRVMPRHKDLGVIYEPGYLVWG